MKFMKPKLSHRKYYSCLSILSIFLLFSGFSRLYPDIEAKSKKTPIIVELFTSQGCSSCPPADQVLSQLFNNQPLPDIEIIALGQHVDYWNYLGWRDIFSSPVFSKRQRRYARFFQSRNVYTPQMIVAGRYEFAGHRYNQAITTIKKAAKIGNYARLHVSAHRKKTATTLSLKIMAQKQVSSSSLYLAIARPNLVTHVKRGENAGQHLGYGSVVHFLKKIRQVSLSKNKSLALQYTYKPNSSQKKKGPSKKLIYVFFIQSNKSGHILGSTLHRS